METQVGQEKEGGEGQKLGLSSLPQAWLSPAGRGRASPSSPRTPGMDLHIGREEVRVPRVPCAGHESSGMAGGYSWPLQFSEVGKLSTVTGAMPRPEL